MYDPDRPSGPAAAGAGSDDAGPPDWFAAAARPDVGPPDWFAAAALPEDEPCSDEPGGGAPDDGPVGADRGAPRPGLAEVPGLRTAAELPSGHRRRRTALAPEPADRTDPGDQGDPESRGGRGDLEEPFHDDAPPARRAGRRRHRPDGDAGPAQEPRRSAASTRGPDEVDPAARARDICLRLLTGTARTRRQLADALRKREIPDDVADEVLSRFEEVGLIDDAAFAEAWVDSRQSRRGLARRALGRELRTRGVSGDLVEAALARVDPEDEAVAARALVDRRLPATRGLDRQARTRRLVALLARRGYGEGLAFRVVREALGEEGEGFGEDW